MGIDRETLRQIGHMLRPLATRVVNTVARAVVKLADDAKKLQILQLGVLAGETIDNCEHHQPYGFSSVPLPGAEAVVVFPSGDRAHPLVIAASDRRYRPTAGQGGEVCMYTDEGDVIRLGRGHVVTVGSSGQVLLGSAAAHDGAIKGTQRDTAEQIALTAEKVFLAALSAYAVAIKPIADPSNAATPALTAAIGVFTSAITTFGTAATASVSTKVKLE